MTEASISPAQLRRRAFIYVRQSTQTQVQRNRESTRRQYELADRARSLGWSPDQVEIIDEDLGRSGASSAERTGFARLTAEVALGQAGIVLGLEVSRLARNNADWYRLLDLCGLTDTLIGDADGIYHPRRHNDRLVLGLLCRTVHNRKRDHGTVDTVLQQVHGRGVTQHEGRDPFFLQLGTSGPGNGQMLGQDVGQPVVAE